MRRSASLPIAGKKKPSTLGGSSKEEVQKVSLAKVLAPYKQFQTGGDLSNGYKVGAHIAAGADGDVYRAIWITAKKEVAVKRIRVASAVIQRHIQQEVAAVFHARQMYTEEVDDLNSTGHPCIVGYLDWFAGPGGVDREVCITMELCNFGIGDLIHTGNVMRIEYEKMVRSRQPLEQLKANSRGKPGTTSGIDPRLYRFPEQELLKVLFQMLCALAFLNRHGIFHRDIKSENILWRQEHPNGGSYKLADFGVAFCDANADPSKRHDDCGTLWTMAPELLGRRPGAGPSSDTWSLAVVIFEMAFYEKPFTSLELLAYRNAGSESWAADGFWHTLCGEKNAGKCMPASSAPGHRWGGSNPSSPKSGAGGFGLGRQSRMLTKQASVPSLPSLASRTSVSEGPTSPPVSPMGKLGKALQRRTLPSELNTSTPTPLSPSRGMGAEEDPSSPSQSPTDTLRQRKRAFLRKRSSLKWVYSEDLRTTIFEEMLEEDAAARPTPAGLLASPKLQGLWASCDISKWSSAEDVARCSARAGSPSKSMRPTSAAGSPSRPSSAAGSPSRSMRPTSATGPPGAEVGPTIGTGPPGAELRPTSATGSREAEIRPTSAIGESCASREATGSPPAGAECALSATVSSNGSNPAVLAGNALRCLTPEAFLAVLKVDRKFDAQVYSHQNYEDSPSTIDGVLTASSPS